MVTTSPGRTTARRKIRYAVVGQGYISQIAVLPAFANAGANSKLTALVSDDPVKLKKLSRKYKVDHVYDYDGYDECLASGNIDAVYIALPNSMHREYAVRAARAGIHVLCEKPMAVTTKECRAMIQAADSHGVQLMIAYRLHFEPVNLKAMEIVRSGKLGEPRIFNSVFCMQVAPGNTRLRGDLDGGTLYDIGIYCINAARYLFQDEPIEVLAMKGGGDERRFQEVEEMTGALLRFPEDRLAAFTCSFGAAKASMYEIIGDKGRLRVEPAYEQAGSLGLRMMVGKRQHEQRFPESDQFSPELLYFSDCILKGRRPEPSGKEGLIDVRIIQALYRSAVTGRAVKLDPPQRRRRPGRQQKIRRPAIKKPPLIHATPPSGHG